jgi:hypothetical protein
MINLKPQISNNPVQAHDPQCPQLYVNLLRPTIKNSNVLRMLLLEPFPQQRLFASSIILRIVSHASEDQTAVLSVGKQMRTMRVPSSSSTHSLPFPPSACRSPGEKPTATIQNCNLCMAWGLKSTNCSFCFNFTIQTPSYSLHDSYIGSTTPAPLFQNQIFKHALPPG